MSKVFKRQRRVAGEGAEEHWIPLSDLMTTLMFVFLLIALAYMVQVQQQSTLTLKLLDDYRLQRNALYEDLDREFHRNFRTWGAELTPDLTIRFHGRDILFEKGSDRLRPRFETILREFYPRYASILDSPKYRNTLKELRIEGTASSDSLFGKSSQHGYIDNMALSQGRARAVLGYVLALANAQDHRGWLEAHATADGLSSSHPVFVNGKEDPALSQRVEFRVMDPLWDRVQQPANAQREARHEALPLVAERMLPRRQQTSLECCSIDAVVIPNADPIVINLDTRPVVGVNEDQSFKIVGWALDRHTNAPARAVYARIDGARLVKAEYGSVRDDVAWAVRNPALNHVGFDVSIPANALSAGKHRIDFYVVSSQGTAYFVVSRRLTLNVRER